MSSMHSSATYQRTEVMSSSPERLIPVLYQHLLVNLKRAILFIERLHDALGRTETLFGERGVPDEGVVFGTNGRIDLERHRWRPRVRSTRARRQPTRPMVTPAALRTGPMPTSSFAAA